MPTRTVWRSSCLQHFSVVGGPREPRLPATLDTIAKSTSMSVGIRASEVISRDLFFVFFVISRDLFLFSAER